MSGLIEDLTGATIIADSGSRYNLNRQAGCGAQGVVYEDSSGLYMVKFYYPSGSQCIDSDIIDRLKFIKSIQMPKNFVSVIDVITKPYVGYVMDKVNDHIPLNSYLIPNKKCTFSEWYNKGLGLYERIFIGYIIAKAFAELEKSNLSYCDISGNNILIKIAKGASVKMIDIDNIYIAGKGKAAVLGTPRYIAPEIISHQRTPDVLSDNYSLAVILFELLRVGHPYISDDILDGTPEDEENALAGNAEYVTDDNSTNMIPSSVVFTGKLKELFERCFVEGKDNRIRRPSAVDFEIALLDASNKLVKCSTCGAWHFPRKDIKGYENCPWCDSPTPPTARLNFYDLLLDNDKYQNGSTIGDKKSGKLVNSYVLKEYQKNIVKSLYVLMSNDITAKQRLSENYFTIANDGKGYYVYNEFSKSGIVLKKYGANDYVTVDNNKALLLHSGDEIFFEITEGQATNIECGGKKYSFIRKAKFMEANHENI